MGKFKDAIVNSRIFKDLSVKDGDMIDGLATYKLSMSLDVTRIDEFVIEYGKIMDEKAVTEMTDRDKEQLKEMEKEVAKILKSNKFTFVTEKESGLVRSAAAEIAFADADSGMEGSFDMNVEYNDINKPVAVEVPAKSTSLLELVGPYLGMFMPQTGGALPTR
jgi:hypothetical protein